MATVRPDEIYNLAAQSHVQNSFSVPIYTGDVDALGVTRILDTVHWGWINPVEYIRRLHLNYMGKWKKYLKMKIHRFILLVRMPWQNNMVFG